MMNLIQNNPYRFLGVPSNATTKEILANSSRIKAFCNVGKHVEYPMDMNAFLPVMERTMEGLETASSALELPDDKLRHAFFWFMNASGTDAEAIEFLKKGNLDMALSALYREQNTSSIINRAVVYWMKKDILNAIKCYLSVIHDNDYRDTFVHSVCGSHVEYPKEKVSQILMDELCKEIPLYELYKSFPMDDADLERDQVGKLIVDYAENELNKALQNEQYKLINECAAIIEKTYPYLAAVELVEGKGSFKHRHWSTKVESNVLNGVISIVNEAVECVNREKQVSYYSFSLLSLKGTIGSASKLMRYLKTMDIDPVALPRLNKQIETLTSLAYKARDYSLGGNGDVAELNLQTEWDCYRLCKTYKDYHSYLEKFPNGMYKKQAQAAYEIGRSNMEQEAGAALDNCKQLDESLRSTKSLCEEAGLLDELDEKCFSLCATKPDFRVYLDVFGDQARHKKEAEHVLRHEIRRKKTKDFVKKNKVWFIIIAALLSVFLAVGLFGGAKGLMGLLKVLMWGFVIVAFVFLKSDIRKKGLYVLLFAALAGGCWFGSVQLRDLADRQEEARRTRLRVDELVKFPSEEKCRAFLSDYPDSSYEDQVLDVYYGLVEKKGIMDLYSFGFLYGLSPQGTKAMGKAKSLSDSLYQVAVKTGSVEGWESYRQSVPSAYYYDSKNKIDSIYNAKWNTEAKAWQEVSQLNNKASFKRYLAMYPKGKHKTLAEKHLIDFEVDSIYAGKTETLPVLNKVSWNGTNSTVTIVNNLNRDFTMFFSGTSVSKKVVMQAKGKNQTITLPNGTYRIAFSNSELGNHVRTEKLTGGRYEASYIITYMPTYRKSY